MLPSQLRQILVVAQTLEHAIKKGDLNVFFSNHEVEAFRKKLVQLWLTNISNNQSLANQNIPINNHHFLELLYKPLNEWGIVDEDSIQYLDEIGFKDLVLLEEHLGLSTLAHEWIYEMGDIEEQDTKVLEHALRHFRQAVRSRFLSEQIATDLYSKFRQFLSKNPIVDESLLNEEVKSISRIIPALGPLLRHAYEEFPIGNFVVCPGKGCGWGARLLKGRKAQCVNPYCKEYNQAKLESVAKAGKLRTKPGIQYYVSLTSYDERNLLEKLGKYGYKVRLYPGVESKGDIEVIKHNQIFYIDVKSYRTPKKLAEWLNDNQENLLASKQIIVVPSRIANNKYYIEKLHQFFPFTGEISIVLEKNLNSYLAERMSYQNTISSEEQNYA
ncbi:restriction endonuclease-related protein [Paenibacillus sp. Root444D2]|uniref:restriction endonuclease-related protein n=1 Tax=Paenibacillus sp. Root444D2 TaxID=1736538 RepID=UPI00070E8444|nr:hypothetical protein [Paenibacillus sp. Root444D2]KQX68471.1 hypothetical protein ASD40_23570 [Paenibacillus sp. Root444D2]